MQIQKLITEGNKRYVIIAMPPTITTAFVSTTGKSLVYRVLGTYLCANGEIKGEDGKYSPYINATLKWRSEYECGKHYSKNDLIKYDFDGIIFTALKIPVL